MHEVLKKIPNVNSLVIEILETYDIEDTIILKQCINTILNQTREAILNKRILDIEQSQLIYSIYELYLKEVQAKHFKCINATGVILHTNLGRARLSKKQLGNIDVLESYNNLEYDFIAQKRGSRYDLVEKIICEITGAKAALVVNNNASAVLLILNEFANNKDVVVSNAELIEIGGSFRIPEIIKLAQAKIKSVGTTNKTHLKDYLNNIDENTGLVAKIHQSNFYQGGFVKSISSKELVLARSENAKDFIIYEDLASGAIYDLSKYGLDYEPTIIESINNGVDIVSFSGDKLLGAIQAGIIVGKKEYIARLKKNQLLRALRPSGIILNIIESTFILYRDEVKAIENIPTLQMLSEDISVSKKKAKLLYKKLADTIKCEVIETSASVGGGCMPKTKIPSFALRIMEVDCEKLKSFYLSAPVPIVVNIKDDSIIINCKTITENDVEYVINVTKMYFSN